MTENAPDRAYAPALPLLSPRAELALLARMLHREGYHDHIAGHITYRQPDQTLLVTPARFGWDEVRAADIMRIDLDGNYVDGPWTIQPAIGLHLELHLARPDVHVAIHNHPLYGTVWADRHRVPPVYDQTSGLVRGEIALFNEYEGTFIDRPNARKAVEALGDARMALLANHGVLVVAPDIEIGYMRAMALEWRCRMAWHVEAGGGDGIPLKPDVVDHIGGRFDEAPMLGLFQGMARREIRDDPMVLSEEVERTVI
jgi:L-fuculose-phosphate aldolase